MLERIRPISYLKAHASEIVRKIAEDQNTVIITQILLVALVFIYSFSRFILFLFL